MKTSDLNIVSYVGATRNRRKALMYACRNGRLMCRIVGNRKDGYCVAVQTGYSVVCVTTAYFFKKDAEAFCVTRFGKSAVGQPLALAA